MARLISVLSFKSKRINYLNLLWHVLIRLLIPSVEEFPLILLRIRGIPGTLFSNFYLWLNSSWSFPYTPWCNICLKTHRSRPSAHDLPLWTGIIGCTSVRGQAGQDFQDFCWKHKPLFAGFIPLVSCFLSTALESKWILVFSGSRELPAATCSW